MEFFKADTNIDFLGLRKYTASISIVAVVISVICLFAFGLNFGLEFTGGTQVELRFADIVETHQIEEVLEESGFGSVRVQHYGSPQDILIRLSNDEEKTEDVLRAEIFEALKAKYPDFEIRRVEYVGSEVGSQLAEQGAVAVIIAILATMVYIALRFEYRFAVSAALALTHDSLIVLGVFAWFQYEFDLAALAAILAVVGYSLNDTIVVFDRVRENFRLIRKGSVVQVINTSINQTLSRTIMTSFLTLLVVLALLFFGGESLFSFSLVLAIGIMVGTYSSIYVAGAMAINFGLSRSDMMPKAKVAIDDMP